MNARCWANEQASEMNPRTLELLCRQICDRDNVEISVLQAPDRSCWSGFNLSSSSNSNDICVRR